MHSIYQIYRAFFKSNILLYLFFSLLIFLSTKTAKVFLFTIILLYITDIY